MKMHRTVATYEACTPEAVASGSKAQMMNFIADAQADIGTLADVNADLIKALIEAREAVVYALRGDLDEDEAAIHGATLEKIDAAIAKAIGQ